MKILVVKLTSMGDLFHLMPALTDLQQSKPDITIDWMAEDSFAQLPLWHPSVSRVIPVSTRAWRSLRWRNLTQFVAFLKDLRKERYDIVIDAQGLIKSAVLGRFARLAASGQRVGFSGDSIKESPAAWLYSKKVVVKRDLHAITRLRRLLADGLDYPIADKKIAYKLSPPLVETHHCNRQSILLFHSTTWASKHLPESVWHEVIEQAAIDGYELKLCWANPIEKLRAERLAKPCAAASVLPKLSLAELAQEIRNSAGVIAVDTGLGHMAAALGVPAVSVYGATDANLTGAVGERQIQLQSDYSCSPCLLRDCAKLGPEIKQIPCYLSIEAKQIWRQLKDKINQ